MRAHCSCRFAGQTAPRMPKACPKPSGFWESCTHTSAHLHMWRGISRRQDVGGCWPDLPAPEQTEHLWRRDGAWQAAHLQAAGSGA